MKFLYVIKWALFWLLLVAVATGVGAAWFWQNSDRLAKRILTERFELAAPDLKLLIGQVRLLPGKTVQLKSLEIRDRKSNQPLLRAAEVVAVIDDTEFFERQRVHITSVVARRIDLLLVRRADGRWNWQDYRFVKNPELKILLPQIAAEDIRAQLILEHGGVVPNANLMLASSSFQAVPASATEYDFSGDVNLPDAGLLALNGGWNLESREW